MPTGGFPKSLSVCHVLPNLGRVAVVFGLAHHKCRPDTYQAMSLSLIIYVFLVG